MIGTRWRQGFCEGEVQRVVDVDTGLHYLSLCVFSELLSNGRLLVVVEPVIQRQRRQEISS